MNAALSYLKELVSSGMEFPEACDLSSITFDVNNRALMLAYDESECK